MIIKVKYKVNKDLLHYGIIKTLGYNKNVMNKKFKLSEWYTIRGLEKGYF